MMQKWDLWASYGNVWATPALKDLRKFLGKRKSIALQQLRQSDSPEARATWKLVDEIYQHIDLVRKEGVREYNESKNK